MMKYLLIENEEGQYINLEDNKRYDILECHEAIGPRADEFVEYDNLEQAMEAFDVEVYHEPVIEEPEIPEGEVWEDPKTLEQEEIPGPGISFFKKIEKPDGEFQDKDGNRYNILTCDDDCEDQEGWLAFESIEEACAAWDLAPVDKE